MATERMVNKQEKTFFQQTQDLAHAYFDSRGKQHGNDLGDWYRAEKELRVQAAEKGMPINESAVATQPRLPKAEFKINEKEFTRNWEKKEPTHEEVQLAAYLDWANDGKPEGNDGVNYYYAAQNRLRTLLNAKPETKKKESKAKNEAENKPEADNKPVTKQSEAIAPERKAPESLIDEEAALAQAQATAPKSETAPKAKTEDELVQEYQALEKRAQEIAKELDRIKKAQNKQAEEPENKTGKATIKPENEKDETDKAKKQTAEDAQAVKNKWDEIFTSAVNRKEAEKTRAELKEELKKEILAEMNKEKEGKPEDKKEEKKKEEEKKAKEPSKIKKFWTKTKAFFQKHKRTIGAFALGAGLTIATLGTMQYFGQFLPIPVRDLYINSFKELIPFGK